MILYICENIVAWKFANGQTSWFSNIYVHKRNFNLLHSYVFGVLTQLCRPVILHGSWHRYMPINWWNVLNQNQNYYYFPGNAHLDQILLLGLLYEAIVKQTFCVSFTWCAFYSNGNSIQCNIVSNWRHLRMVLIKLIVVCTVYIRFPWNFVRNLFMKCLKWTKTIKCRI